MILQKTLHHNFKQQTVLGRLRLEPRLTALICLLSLCGIIILYSASSGAHVMVERQLVRLCTSFCIFLMFAQIPIYKCKNWAPYLFGIGMLMLLGVLLVGKVGKGAQRWLDLGFFKFQPSELMKMIVPIMLAWFYSRQTLPIQLKQVIIGGLVIFMPALLIAKQPDLGTALMLVFSGCVVVFFAGISYRLIGMVAVICLSAAPFLWNHMHDYQRLRVLNFLDPERDPLGSGYHIIQSKIAIGSGGVYGKGFLNGSQSHLHFLPEHATDFIFAVLGEEMGLIGCLLLIFLFFMIVYRCLQIAYKCEDLFAKLLVVSLTMNFFLSAFVNMGMVAGILPVVGIPLPLVSYGGSSMLVLFASFGMIMSVYATKHNT